MRIDPDYKNYYVYNALCNKGKQVSSSACPVVWEDDPAVPDSQWQKGLTWADGKYHLYDCIELNEDDIDYVDDAILTALNEKEETFGEITLDTGYEVRWCLLEEEQMRIIMDIPDLAGGIEA